MMSLLILPVNGNGTDSQGAHTGVSRVLPVWKVWSTGRTMGIVRFIRKAATRRVLALGEVREITRASGGSGQEVYLQRSGVGVSVQRP